MSGILSLPRRRRYVENCAGCDWRKLADPRGREGHDRRAAGEYPAHRRGHSRLIELGYRLVITHGNGPQVGAQLLRSERASDVAYSQTLDVCGAASQGEIGYLLAQSLHNELAVGRPQGSGGLRGDADRGVGRRSGDAASLQADWAVLLASRCRREERARWAGRSWKMLRAAIAASCRRPSRWKLSSLSSSATWSTTARWSSPPAAAAFRWFAKSGGLRGVEAVIDKDRASAVLASQLGVDLFAISTDTDYVYLNYKKPNQVPLIAGDRFRAGEALSRTDISRRATWGRRSSRC